MSFTSGFWNIFSLFVASYILFGHTLKVLANLLGLKQGRI